MILKRPWPERRPGPGRPVGPGWSRMGGESHQRMRTEARLAMFAASPPLASCGCQQLIHATRPRDIRLIVPLTRVYLATRYCSRWTGSGSGFRRGSDVRQPVRSVDIVVGFVLTQDPPQMVLIPDEGCSPGVRVGIPIQSSRPIPPFGFSRASRSTRALMSGGSPAGGLAVHGPGGPFSACKVARCRPSSSLAPIPSGLSAAVTSRGGWVDGGRGWLAHGAAGSVAVGV
jgi:hypothetical protein